MSAKNVKWEWKKLGEVSNIYNGNSINEKVKKERYLDIDDGYPFIATKDVSFDCNVDYNNGVKIPFNERNFKVAKKGSVLICAEGGSAGRKKCFLNQDVCFGNKLFAVDCSKLDLLGKFAFYYVHHDFFLKEFKKLMAGIIGGVSSAKFKEILIPVPPIDEQKRIVNVLDETFEKIEKIKANAQANLQNAKDLFQTTLFASFEKISVDDNYLLKDVAIDFSRGKSKHRPRNDKILFGGEYPFIQTGDIRNADKYVAEYTDTYNEVGLAQSKLWPEGTLCITIAANIAETAVLTIPCCFPDSIIGFVPDIRKTDVDYVYYLLQYFKGELQIMGKGAAQDNLNLGTFEKMKFPFPPLPIQKQIVAKLDSLSEKVKQLESNYKQILADCEELKKAVLKKAFNGNL